MKFIKENIRLIIAVTIALILIIAGVILISINNEEKASSTKTPVEEIDREEQLAEVTGMTGDKAIEIVKENFLSDNYKYKVDAMDDGLYRVIVTNTIENSKIVYFVDPTTGAAYIDMGAQ